MTKNVRYRLYEWGLGILLLYMVASAAIFIGHGYVDFPFFLEYDPENKVISYRHYVGQDTEATTPRIEAYFDVYYANYSGMGPDYERSETDVLRVDTLAGQIELRRDGDELLVNGQRLPVGQMYERTSYWHLNPWLKAHVQMKNLGLVTVEHLRNSKPRLAVHGTYGTAFAPLKGGLIALVLVSLLALAIWKRHPLRKNR